MISKHVRAAKPIGDQIVPRVCLEISDYIPDKLIHLEGGVDHVRAIFRNDAEIVFDVLRSLPGGTFDQLLILMLQKQACSFIVPHDFHDGEKTKPSVPEWIPYLLITLDELITRCEPSEYDFDDQQRAWQNAREMLAKAKKESEATRRTSPASYQKLSTLVERLERNCSGGGD